MGVAVRSSALPATAPRPNSPRRGELTGKGRVGGRGGACSPGPASSGPAPLGGPVPGDAAPVWPGEAAPPVSSRLKAKARDPRDPLRLLLPRDFPGSNTGVGCYSLLQAIFLIQGSSPRRDNSSVSFGRCRLLNRRWGSVSGFPGGPAGKASACNMGRKTLRRRECNPLQYPCLENTMDGGAGYATVRGVAKSWTRLSDFTFLFRTKGPHKQKYFSPIKVPCYGFTCISGILASAPA